MKISEKFEVTSPSELSNFNKTLDSFCGYLGKGLTITKVPLIYQALYKVPVFLGIEIEVEKQKEITIPSFWKQEGDQSLRHGGKEFKTVPVTPEQAYKALAVMYALMGKESSFSWRCGLHVHVNCTELQEEELKRFTTLFLLLEGMLFAVAGKDREQNHNCVPLCHSTLTHKLHQYLTGSLSIKELVNCWNGGGGHAAIYKYSAVNFARLSDLGTVEFRHLGGTQELSVVNLWLALIISMYAYAIMTTKEELHKTILDLNTSRSYFSFVKGIFGKEITAELQENMDVSFTEALEENVTKVKEILTPQGIKNCNPDSSMMSYAVECHKHAETAPKKEGTATKK